MEVGICSQGGAGGMTEELLSSWCSVSETDSLVQAITLRMDFQIHLFPHFPYERLGLDTSQLIERKEEGDKLAK